MTHLKRLYQSDLFVNLLKMNFTEKKNLFWMESVIHHRKISTRNWNAKLVGDGGCSRAVWPDGYIIYSIFGHIQFSAFPNCIISWFKKLPSNEPFKKLPKTLKLFAKVAKFRQIRSHCSRFIFYTRFGTYSISETLLWKGMADLLFDLLGFNISKYKNLRSAMQWLIHRKLTDFARRS